MRRFLGSHHAHFSWRGRRRRRYSGNEESGEQAERGRGHCGPSLGRLPSIVSLGAEPQPESERMSKKKIRVDLRKNRSKPPRDKQWTQEFAAHGFDEKATVGDERIRSKGELSRK